MEPELTLKEVQSRGGKATASKYSKQERAEWYKKGGQITKAKYGKEHYQELNRKSHEAKRLKKQANSGT